MGLRWDNKRMINPTKDDIGRKVIYHLNPAMFEVGVITSFNDKYVFVRYGADIHSKATRREDLEYERG